MKKSQPIGIFDSGIGGLTVARTLGELLPDEQLIYFGDTAHMPYGDKSAEEIVTYCRKIVEFLLSKQVKLIVIACNSASSVAAGILRREYWQQIEIMGVIRPVIRAVLAKKITRLGIIGTRATVESNIYPGIFAEYGEPVQIYQKATPLLAPMIESGQQESKAMTKVLNEYLSDARFADDEAILLACTHYPLIKEQVDRFFEGKKMILDNATPLAEALKDYLGEKNLLASSRQAENDRVRVSKYLKLILG